MKAVLSSTNIPTSSPVRACAESSICRAHEMVNGEGFLTLRLPQVADQYTLAHLRLIHGTMVWSRYSSVQHEGLVKVRIAGLQPLNFLLQYFWEWGLKICISNKFSSEAGTALWEPLPYSLWILQA